MQATTTLGETMKKKQGNIIRDLNKTFKRGREKRNRLYWERFAIAERAMEELLGEFDPAEVIGDIEETR